MIRLLTMIAFLLVPVVLLGCSVLNSPTGSGGDPVGPVWILTELNGEQPISETTVFLKFSEEGSANGSDGCNNMGRAYTIDGNKIEFSAAGPTTLMACPAPIMDQATAFQEALTNAATFTISGDTLTLFDADGNSVAVFQDQDQSIAGTSWTVLSYNNGKGGFTSVILDTEITAVFGEDGNVTGNDSCNNYSRPYETDGIKISFGEPGASTMMACPDEINEQAMAYQQALTNSATYEMIGNSFTLYDANGTRMVLFTR